VGGGECGERVRRMNIVQICVHMCIKGKLHLFKLFYEREKDYGE
jgi:hypothetical protein